LFYDYGDKPNQQLKISTSTLDSTPKKQLGYPTQHSLNEIDRVVTNLSTTLSKIWVIFHSNLKTTEKGESSAYN